MTTRLQEQDRQRRDLLADIAHELRTPLAVVQGRLEGVLDGVYPRDDEQMGEVLEETRMLARLVEDLGTLAHAERGVMGLKKEAHRRFAPGVRRGARARTGVARSWCESET